MCFDSVPYYLFWCIVKIEKQLKMKKSFKSRNTRPEKFNNVKPKAYYTKYKCLVNPFERVIKRQIIVCHNTCFLLSGKFQSYTRSQTKQLLSAEDKWGKKSILTVPNEDLKPTPACQSLTCLMTKFPIITSCKINVPKNNFARLCILRIWESPVSFTSTLNILLSSGIMLFINMPCKQYSLWKVFLSGCTVLPLLDYQVVCNGSCGLCLFLLILLPFLPYHPSEQK